MVNIASLTMQCDSAAAANRARHRSFGRPSLRRPGTREIAGDCGRSREIAGGPSISEYSIDAIMLPGHSKHVIWVFFSEYELPSSVFT